MFLIDYKQNRSSTCRGRLHPCLPSLGSKPVLQAVECANLLYASLSKLYRGATCQLRIRCSLDAVASPPPLNWLAQHGAA